MQTPESSLEVLANRVAKLEAQNRWLKKAGIASLIVAATVIGMGQAQSNRTVEANEFVLQDTAGRVRAKLFMKRASDPTLSLYDASGAERAQLSQGRDAVFMTFTNNPAEKYGGLQLSLSPDSSNLNLTSVKHKTVILLTTLSPALSIHGSEGYETIVGTMETESSKTGETHKTSAASIKLIGADREILWSAP